MEKKARRNFTIELSIFDSLRPIQKSASEIILLRKMDLFLLFFSDL